MSPAKWISQVKWIKIAKIHFLNTIKNLMFVFVI